MSEDRAPEELRVLEGPCEMHLRLRMPGVELTLEAGNERQWRTRLGYLAGVLRLINSGPVRGEEQA